ncbi:MAG: PhzF family phenazine biosynthesis protein [Spirochaetia bacterium]|nr:PhzF family phenazine biosynthesis protein [Spirochaetia bacterium]
MPIQVVSTGVAFLMVPLKSLELVKKAEMNRPEIRKLLKSLELNAMLVSAPEGFTPEGDIFSRLMDPDNAGEDPYTGSATGCMGSYLYHYGVITNPQMRCEQGHLLAGLEGE